MKTILTMISAGLLFISTSCNKPSMQDIKPADDNSQTAARGGFPETYPAVIMPVQTPVYYNGKVFNVQVKMDYPSPYLNHVVVNTIYMTREPLLPGTTIPKLIPLVSALPGMNFDATTIWEVAFVTFNEVNLKPFQLLSVDELDKILAGPNPSVSVTKTGSFVELSMSKNQPMVTK